MVLSDNHLNLAFYGFVDVILFFELGSCLVRWLDAGASEVSLIEALVLRSKFKFFTFKQHVSRVYIRSQNKSLKLRHNIETVPKLSIYAD